MPYFETCIWILVGLITGSFVNLCIDRLPLQFAEKDEQLSFLNSPKLSSLLKNYVRECKLSLIKPTRSFCFFCGYQLRWFENIPMLSYILIKGRCRTCKVALGLRIIFTETMHGIWYGIFGWIFQNWIWSISAGINFSFLWILAYCRSHKKLRIKLYYAGWILLTMNLLMYLFFIK